MQIPSQQYRLFDERIMNENVDMTLEDELNHIKQFKHHIMLKLSGNYPPLNQSQSGQIFPEVRGESSNRGNKLYQNCEDVTYTKLKDVSNKSKVFYNGAEHKLLSRKRMKFDNTRSNEDEKDLNNLVDVQKVLSPIFSLKDVVEHPSHSKTFKNIVLRELALNNVLMVEKEQANVVNYSKLLEIFLGDFPNALYEDRLKLEPYDHNLTFKDEDEVEGENEMENGNKRKAGVTDEDAFFSLPQFNELETLMSLIPLKYRTGNKSEPISGELTDEVETTRQLAQIALQRNQEFIRNLQKIRNCISKANRIRERILMWSKEYVGIPEDGVTIPNALHVVKRGLISATTNQAQRIEEEDSESEE